MPVTESTPCDKDHIRGPDTMADPDIQQTESILESDEEPDLDLIPLDPGRTRKPLLTIEPLVFFLFLAVNLSCE